MSDLAPGPYVSTVISYRAATFDSMLHAELSLIPDEAAVEVYPSAFPDQAGREIIYVATIIAWIPDNAAPQPPEPKE